MALPQKVFGVANSDFVSAVDREGGEHEGETHLFQLQIEELFNSRAMATTTVTAVTA